MRRWVSWGGALAAAAAGAHLLAAGYPPGRLHRVGVVGEALLFPAQDWVAWAVLLLTAAVLLGRWLPEARPEPAGAAAASFTGALRAAGLRVGRARQQPGGPRRSRRAPSDVDDIARLHQARIFLEGRLFVEAPPEPKAFGVYGLLARAGRWFSRYEPGPSLLYALSWKIAGTRSRESLLGGALAAALYALARRAGGEATARVAALLLCLSPFVLGMSGSLQSHPLAALALLAACLFVSLGTRNTSRGSPQPGRLAVAVAARPWTAAGRRGDRLLGGPARGTPVRAAPAACLAARGGAPARPAPRLQPGAHRRPAALALPGLRPARGAVVRLHGALPRRGIRQHGAARRRPQSPAVRMAVEPFVSPAGGAAAPPFQPRRAGRRRDPGADRRLFLLLLGRLPVRPALLVRGHPVSRLADGPRADGSRSPACADFPSSLATPNGARRRGALHRVRRALLRRTAAAALSE